MSNTCGKCKGNASSRELLRCFGKCKTAFHPGCIENYKPEQWSKLFKDCPYAKFVCLSCQNDSDMHALAEISKMKDDLAEIIKTVKNLSAKVDQGFNQITIDRLSIIQEPQLNKPTPESDAQSANVINSDYAQIVGTGDKSDTIQTVVVRKKQYLYVSRLHPSTVCDNVKSFVSSKLNVTPSDIDCWPLIPKNREISSLNFVSFKVGLFEEDAIKALVPDFWPSVHSFPQQSNNAKSNIPQCNSLHVYYHNCSGIRSKAKTIYSSILANDYDLILFGETWLNSMFNVEEFFPPIYTVFRRDRHANSPELNRRGGGLVIAVSNDLTFKYLDVTCNFGELLAVKVKCGWFWLYIINIYIPFGSGGDIYIGLIEFIRKEILPLLAEGDHIVVVGDFNLPKIVWTQIDEDFVGCSNDFMSSHILDSFLNFGTHQINRIRNNMGRILDLVFTSHHSAQVVACTDLAGSSSIYHTPLLIKVNFFEYSITEFIKKDVKFDFFNSDFVSLNNYFENINWSELLINSDISGTITRFNDVLNIAFDKFVPKKVIRCRYNEPWFNRELKNLANRKSKASKLFKKSNSIIHYEKYSSLEQSSVEGI